VDDPFQDYYGLVEKISQDNNYFQIVIDSVLQLDFDKYVKFNGDFNLRESRTSVLYISLKRDDCEQLFPKFNPFRLDLRWVRYSLTTISKKLSAKKYVEGVEDSNDVFFKSLNFLDKRKDKKIISYLEKAYSLNKIGKPFSENYTEFESRIKDKTSKCVSVYDVGQGNANSICFVDSNIPLIYYDLGGGSYGNRHTYVNIKSFCIEEDPVVFLSHWDADHYFSAIKSKALHKLKWIVPNQKIGPEAYKFAEKIANNGNMYIFDINTISNKVITVLKGSGKSKNDSGLILVVKCGDHKSQEIILLPGDCRYKYIPDIEKLKITCLVASHHGGTFRGKKYVPKTKGGKLALSYGMNNTYKHPSNEMIKCYKKAGWNKQLNTLNGNISFIGKRKTKKYCLCKNSGIKIQQFLI
jgi:beta-lactamase superfamily II metal-dependent hydrolase